jgi:tetratricopeptide (TPR) repeat protein
MTESHLEGSVPAYLGRILDGGGGPVGTCFQVAPGVLVTAWHVLDEFAGAVPDARVLVDPLGGGESFQTTVARLDQVHDLAVLTCEDRLPGTAGELVATDRMAPGTPVTVTGHCVIDDAGHTARSLTTIGQWAGPATWEDAMPTGRMTAESLLPGMSGAPVIRTGDGTVAGVVAGRYNSVDGWLAGTVWVVRTEDLVALLNGITPVAVKESLVTVPVDLLLTVTEGHVQLTGAGLNVAADHSGVRPGLLEAVQEMRRARGRAGLAVRADGGPQTLASHRPLERVGRLLGESFLSRPVADGLGRALAAAEREHQPVRLGLAVSAQLAGLPWEALPAPNGRGPLALHPLVSVYRRAEAPGARQLPGPLRVVVAIAAPDSGGGTVLDYERELRNVLAAVRAARQGAADVRVVPFATPAAIRAELDRGQAHILHISGHGSPGNLYLEDEDGAAQPVTAEQFLVRAVPPGRMPPVITLSACYTDAAGSQDGVSFAARLCQHGAAAVIATETTITDTYAARLLARVYGTLAQARDADIIFALAQARREVQAELDTSPDIRDKQLAGLGEWSAITVLAASGSVPVLDREYTARAAAAPSRPRIAGLAGRDDWYFVGRRPEQRRWPTDLTDSGLAGIVIYGIGGTGKTTLAAEITARIRDHDPGRVLVSLTGPLTLENLLSTVITAIRRELLVRGQGGMAIQALDVAGRADLPWPDRLAILREHVLGHVPVMLLLDNFEDNLYPSNAAGHAVRDEVLAELLAAWATDPGESRLLVTSRYPFRLPGGADRTLSFRQLGPLSRVEAMKLAWSLPALDQLDERQLEQVWRLVGGHPRSLEYLDALLAGGTARYSDVTERLKRGVSGRLNTTERDQLLGSGTSFNAALAETVALAADDVLLKDLLAQLGQVDGAVDLLRGVSVYREPVDINAVLFQAGLPDSSAEINPDRAAAARQIINILAEAGIATDAPVDIDSVPTDIRTRLAPYLGELNRRPAPPYQVAPELSGQVTACQAAGLLTIIGENREQRFFVHRWTASELAAQAEHEIGSRLTVAHRKAAAYWQWRVHAWPQDEAADVHDLLEARHHLLQSSDINGATDLTDAICEKLETWGAWDQGAALIFDTLARLPPDHPRPVALIQQLGTLALRRGDYDEAARQYQRALDISTRSRDQEGMASVYHNLGVLASQRGDYDQAVRQYQRALDINKRLNNQAQMAAGHNQLGILARRRGDYDEAARQYQRALDIHQRLGNQTESAAGYLNLGVLARARGEYAEAIRQTQRAIDINQRLGNQADIAAGYNNLAVLAQQRGDYDEAARQYQRALEIRERLGDQAGMAAGYHNLGALAQLGRDYDEAARQYQRAIDINERLGDQARMAAGYHNLGGLAQLREDYDEAARQYQRAIDINERLGNQADMAAGYHNLGMLASYRGDYDEAAHQYEHALQINQRLGNQADMAAGYSQLGVLEQKRGGSDMSAITLHLKAMLIRGNLGIPEALIDLESLAIYRSKLGTKPFTKLLVQIVGNAELAKQITALVANVPS